VTRFLLLVAAGVIVVGTFVPWYSNSDIESPAFGSSSASTVLPVAIACWLVAAALVRRATRRPPIDSPILPIAAGLTLILVLLASRPDVSEASTPGAGRWILIVGLVLAVGMSAVQSSRASSASG
jgi:hypothetical protein